MAYADLPDKYQPPAVRARAAGIAHYLTSIALANHPNSERRRLLEKYVADHKAEQEGRVNDLLRTVVEHDGDAGILNKARYMQLLPVPAALAAIGVLNALGYISRLQQDAPNHPDTPKVIPYYLGVAAAWNHVGRLLAGTALVPDQNADPAQPWPPPWLDFLQDPEL